MENTHREIRENLIMQWYEKKLNRDELLRVLEENEIMDKESKKKIIEEIIKNFYENYEKAKVEGGYQTADVEYKDIKGEKRQLKRKTAELAAKKEERQEDMDRIDEEMDEISKIAMELENGSWWKKMKYNKTNARRDELKSQLEKMRSEIRWLEKEKVRLESSIKEKEERYGGSIERRIKRNDRIKYGGVEKKDMKEETLLGYKKKYMQMVKDKERYMEDFMREIRGLDLGLGEEKQKEILEKVETNMKKEIEGLKKGDETTRMADEKEKWLEENRKVKMMELLDLKRKIEEGERKIREMGEQGGRDSTDKEIKKQEYDLKRELYQLQDEYEQTKTELEEKLKEYDGSYISEEEFVVETRGERKERERKKIEERKRKEVKEKLDPFRKFRKEKIDLDEEIKEKIIKAADKIPIVMNIESDGSRMIEMKIGGKTYRILDMNMEEHTDWGYKESFSYHWTRKCEVSLGGMIGDDVNERKNQKLKEYVKMKEREGLHIPKIEEIKGLLQELGKEADLDNIPHHQIAMLMYLTGMYGWYWLSSNSQEDGHPLLICCDQRREFVRSEGNDAGLCIMVAS